MMSSKVALLTTLFLLLWLGSSAQKGNNEVQVAAQLSFPTGDLAKLTKIGSGYSAKGLWGIGKARRQLTTELSCNFFDFKDKWLSKDVHVFYGGYTLYGGYRYKVNNLFFEPQAGLAIYTIDGYNSLTVVGVSETKRYFDWAVSAGYSLGHFDLGVRYQSAQVSNSKDITFFGIRLGYKFFISKLSRQLYKQSKTL